MDIKNAKFITSMDSYIHFKGIGLPQIAIVGRSNVGKSSLINALCKNNKLCKTSSTPGKTRLINVFEITLFNDQIEKKVHIVDLPGYGYAKVNNAEKIKWGKMMEEYFINSDLLTSIFHLVDIRHTPTKEDENMNHFIRSTDKTFKVIATKSDKISKAARMKHIAEICRTIQVQPWEVLPFSSETKDGRNALINTIYECIN